MCYSNFKNKKELKILLIFEINSLKLNDSKTRIIIKSVFKKCYFERYNLELFTEKNEVFLFFVF